MNTVTLQSSDIKVSNKSNNLMSKISFLISKYSLWIGLGIVVASWLPFLILGENTYLPTSDCLTYLFTYGKFMGKYFFSLPSTTMDEILCGTPRCFFLTNFHFYFLPNAFLSPFVAYSINELVMKLFVFFGMYLFCNRHLKVMKYASVLVATSFALLHFHHNFEPGIVFTALLFYAFMNFLKRKENLADYIICIAFPFFSQVVYTGFFF